MIRLPAKGLMKIFTTISAHRDELSYKELKKINPFIFYLPKQVKVN